MSTYSTEWNVFVLTFLWTFVFLRYIDEVSISSIVGHRLCLPDIFWALQYCQLHVNLTSSQPTSFLCLKPPPPTLLFLWSLPQVKWAANSVGLGKLWSFFSSLASGTHGLFNMEGDLSILKLKKSILVNLMPLKSGCDNVKTNNKFLPFIWWN